MDHLLIHAVIEDIRMGTMVGRWSGDQAAALPRWLMWACEKERTPTEAEIGKAILSIALPDFITVAN